MRDETLTYDKLLNIVRYFDSIKPVLYYATQKDIELGKLLFVKKTDFYPEFIVCNELDVDRLKREFIHRKLVPLSEYGG